MTDRTGTVQGEDLRAARMAAGASLADVSALAHLSVSSLSRLERTGTKPPPAHVVRAYAQALGHEITAGFAATVQRAASPTLADVRRRRLGEIVAAWVGAATLQPVADLLDTLPLSRAPRRVGLSDVLTVEKAVDFFTELDLRGGGGLAADMAHSSLRASIGLLDLEMKQPVRARLHTAVAALADRVAWCYYDAGQPDAALRLYTRALNTAADGGDATLRAHIMLNLSTLTNDDGDPRGAVELIRAALGHDEVDLGERANLASVGARHLGGMGTEHRQAALRHIGLAEQMLSQTATAPDEAPVWARRLTAAPGHFDSSLGMAYFAIEDDEAAATRLTQAVASLGAGRLRGVARCRARLAVIYLRGGDKTGAETQARLVLRAATELRSVRIRDDLRMLEGNATRYGLPALATDIHAALY